MQNVHPQSKDKNKRYFEPPNKTLKIMKLDALSEFFRRNSKIVEASYNVALKMQS